MKTGDSVSSEKSYKFVTDLDSIIEYLIKEYSIQIPNTFRRRFELDDSIKDEDELNTLLEHEISWSKNKFPLNNDLVGIDHYKQAINFLSRLNEHFEVLSPKNVLNTKKTDCKGKAILAVAFHRKQNKPVKLATTNYHVFIELWRNREQEWILFDPTYLRYSTKLDPTRDKDFNYFYEKVINNFNNRK